MLLHPYNPQSSCPCPFLHRLLHLRLVVVVVRSSRLLALLSSGQSVHVCSQVLFAILRARLLPHMPSCRTATCAPCVVVSWTACLSWCPLGGDGSASLPASGSRPCVAVPVGALVRPSSVLLAGGRRGGAHRVPVAAVLPHGLMRRRHVVRCHGAPWSIDSLRPLVSPWGSLWPCVACRVLALSVTCGRSPGCHAWAPAGGPPWGAVPRRHWAPATSPYLSGRRCVPVPSDGLSLR